MCLFVCYYYREIKSGIENLKNITKKENLTKWLEDDLLKKFENKIINIDVDIMITWGRINQNLKNIGKSLPVFGNVSNMLIFLYTMQKRVEEIK